MLPPLLPNGHLEPKQADAVGKKLRQLYLNGDSVRELAENTGYSIQRVRSLLIAAGTPMRPRGRSGAIMESPKRKKTTS
jgi:hypothetical protein